MNKRFFIYISIFLLAFYVAFKYHTRLKHVIFSQPRNPTGLNILLVNVEVEGFGGREVHTMHLYKHLKKHGQNPILLIAKDCLMEEELIKNKIPYYACSKFKILKNEFFPSLYSHLKQICKENNIQVIHTDCSQGLNQINKLSKELPIKRVFTLHTASLPSNRVFRKIKNVNGIIGVSPHVTSKLRKSRDEGKVNVKNITTVFPFFDEEKFVNYKSQETREQFYKKHFGIITQQLPVIICIARLDHNKYIPTLLEATHNLIHKQNKPVEVMLAGRGEKQQELEELAKKLNIEKYVHFLGYTALTPGLLHHSDIKALPSRQEALGICLIEASLMKKPLVAHPKMGTKLTVIHEKTGLGFKKSDSEDMALQLARLIDNPAWARELGENAYKNATTNLSLDNQIKKLVNLYKTILAT